MKINLDLILYESIYYFPSAKVSTNMLSRFYTGRVDTSIFRSGTLTVYGDQLATFNQAVTGTIKFMQ